MTVRLPQALDASVALIADGFLSLPGMDWWDAIDAVTKLGRDEVPATASGKPVVREKTEEEKVAENNAVLAGLMGGLKQTNFGGVKL